MGRTVTKTKASAAIPASGELYAKHFNDAEIHRRAKPDPDAQTLTAKRLGFVINQLPGMRVKMASSMN
jgi:hypothetical protein